MAFSNSRKRREAMYRRVSEIFENKNKILMDIVQFYVSSFTKDRPQDIKIIKNNIGFEEELEDEIIAALWHKFSNLNFKNPWVNTTDENLELFQDFIRDRGY